VNPIEVSLVTNAPVCRQSQTRTIGRPRDHKPGDVYGMSFLRPLARRRLSTRRPALVAMRARKPCVRFRRTLLGW
jgi:hypothetical protein